MVAKRRWGFLRRIVAIAFLLAGFGYTAFTLSPWPASLLIRYVFDREADRTNAALARHVPDGVAQRLDLRYDASDADALLDVYFPADDANNDAALPTIVWVHGGGWVSGNKTQIGNYLRILAAHGYTTVGIDYSIAPGVRYPQPLHQLNAALAYLVAEAKPLHVDPAHLVLAGDSAGAQIAAQFANIVTVPEYAHEVGITPSIAPVQLVGMILHCGAYEFAGVDTGGEFGGFIRTVLWAYSGTRDFVRDPRFGAMQVTPNVTAAFPPTFISAGNDDPLLPMSRSLAHTLEAHRVRVDSLFFADDHLPKLPHEYQFNLDGADGRLVLERTLGFMTTLH